MRIESLIGDVNDLPTLPSVIAKILDLLSDPTSTAEDVTAVMESDPALAAKVLKLANSSYYGLTNKVSSVKHGVVVLGFSTIKSLALSASVFDAFNYSHTGAFSHEAFWEHSSACAFGARFIAQHYRINGVDPEDAFMAGLLHDIGILLLEQSAKDSFDEILDISLDEELSYDEAEREVISTDHGKIGAYLGEHWNLPSQLIGAIRDHHALTPGVELNPLTRVVHLADYVCDKNKLGSSGGRIVPALGIDTLSALGFEESQLEAIVTAMTESIPAEGSLFGA